MNISGSPQGWAQMISLTYGPWPRALFHVPLSALARLDV